MDRVSRHIAIIALCFAFFSAAGVSNGADDSLFTGPKGRPPVDETLERARRQSALETSRPLLQSIEQNGNVLWETGQNEPARLAVGEWYTIRGRGFGQGPDIDYSKILVGTSRALERDVRMYKGTVNYLKELFYEKPRLVDEWPMDIRRWQDDVIEFRVPRTASGSTLIIHVQKRIDGNRALGEPSRTFSVWDPMTERIRGRFSHAYDTISRLGEPRVSNIVPIVVHNPALGERIKRGEAIFWSYDFNIGLTHQVRGLDWTRILRGEAVDPVTGLAADPERLFGAIPVRQGEVPAVAERPLYFDPFPIPMPIRPLLRPPLKEGWTEPTGYVGYVYAESIHPVTQQKGKWIGFSCVSCHGQRITYEVAPGRYQSKVFAGLPNPEWSMKWNVLSKMKGIKGEERGPDGTKRTVDKTLLLYYMPNGTGEHSMVREYGDGSHYANDHLFSPIAIPIITRHTPVRRALTRSELIIGFEGSYVHAEEPDGAVGALTSDALTDLTAYMTTLDGDDELLERLGLYRWLKRNHLLDEVDHVSESEFLAKGKTHFPKLQDGIERGKAIFRRDCQSCHQPNFGTWTDENMFPLDEVGTYFSPTIYHMQTQSIRTAIIRNLFWVEPRGLLHDGHVKSLEDLVDPDRCEEGSDLYRRYYTINSSTFRIPKGDSAQEIALRRHAYFSEVPWDSKHLYWDYQKMRREFGPRELKTSSPVPLPASPHPWCTRSKSEVQDLVRYLLTL